MLEREMEEREAKRPRLLGELIKVGDIVGRLYDDGWHGDVIFYKVVKVGPVKIKIRGERGEEAWKYPRFVTLRGKPEDFTERK